MIQYSSEDIAPIEIKQKTTDWLTSLLISEGFKAGKIHYIFMSDEALLKINRQFLHHDYYTDIITFDYVRGKTVSGDIFVSLPRIKENARIHNTDYNLEVHRVLAHGLLHLCGYKDKTADEQCLMRERENFYLNLL